MAVAAWAWFGMTGAVPVVVWWWHSRPVPAAGHWRLELARVRAARLGPWRTRIMFRGRPPVEIFNDELSGRDLAELRRTLKTQLAGN